jgi:two-component system capsular synthesis response regulator RcsB
MVHSIGAKHLDENTVEISHVVIADDHPVILLGVKQTLEKREHIRVIGQATNSTELVEILERESVDILITDLSMPGGSYGDGLSLLTLLRRTYPVMPIVVLTMLNNPSLVVGVQKLGVQGIVSKVDDLEHLTKAIDEIREGRKYLSPAVAQMLGEGKDATLGAPVERILSNRELEVVRLYTAGMSVKEIADYLERSIKTVSTQKSSAMRKLGLVRDAELYQYAQANGLHLETTSSTED